MSGATKSEALQRPSAEDRYADELVRLAERDDRKARPPGWRLSPRSVLDFVLGNAKLEISPKFVGERRFVERCIVALATNRGLMLIGEPGPPRAIFPSSCAPRSPGIPP